MVWIDWIGLVALTVLGAWSVVCWVRYRLALRELRSAAEELIKLQTLADQIKRKVDEYDRLAGRYRTEGGPSWP